MGRTLGDPTDPLLVSVRSGAKFSMPGMMETVLNVGLNDESVNGLAAASKDERFALDSYRRLVQMFGSTVLGIEGSVFAEALDAAKRAARHRGGPRPRRGGPARPRRDVQGAGARARRPRLPAGAPRAARPRRARGLRLVEHRAGGALPPPGADPRGPRHRGQRAGDGVRQPGHGLRLRGRVHPRPGVRRAGGVRRLPAERAGRGRGGRHPQHRVAGRHAATSRPARTPSCCGSWPPSSTTTATCATSSSPSRTTSSGCSRPGSASAPPRRRSGSRCTWPTRA